MVREAFAAYVAEELRSANVSYAPGALPMAEWARYRHTLHVDGISCSSRLPQQLALGGVVIREQSGYLAFYDRPGLLQPMLHFLPFWRDRPHEVLAAMEWVAANEDAAQRMAARGQAFVRRYLSKQALECFWLLLLRALARLQRFQPGQRGGKPLRLMPVEEWLAAQEGLVKGWGLGHVTDIGAELELLPEPW
jgi:hypothetical protein